MTSYITREEYDRLSARLDALEAGTVKIKVSGPSEDDYVKALVRRGIQEGLRAFSCRQVTTTKPMFNS